MVSQYLCNYQAIQQLLISIKNFQIVFTNANHVDFPFREGIQIDFILFDPWIWWIFKNVRPVV